MALTYSTTLVGLTARLTFEYARPWLYGVTGLGYGMRIKKLLPEGLLLISVPYDIIPMLIENLHEMDWVLPITTLNDEERGKYSAKIMEEIRQEYLNG